MIHIKETEIIPLLKTAQTGYTKMISEGDLEMEVELAERSRKHSRRRWISYMTTKAWQTSISGWSKNTRQKHQ